MRINFVNIISDRKYESWVSFQLIYEWEDQLSKTLNIPIIDNPDRVETSLKNSIKYNISERVAYPLIKFFRAVKRCFTKESEIDCSLYFHLTVTSLIQLKKSRLNRITPVIVDAFIADDYLPVFYKKYGDCPLVLISSIETYEYLKSVNCPLNIRYWGLSLSDDYKLDSDNEYDKEIDILLAGRQNDVLLSYLEQYLQDNKQIEVVRSDIEDGQLIFTSNNRGALGSFNGRNEYIDLLRKSRVIMYATPGIDGGEKRTKGYNPVTPKYLEALSSQCKIVARYPDTVETKLYEVDKLCSSTDSYDTFKSHMDRYLDNSNKIDLPFYASILNKHYTSVRGKELQEIIQNLN